MKRRVETKWQLCARCMWLDEWEPLRCLQMSVLLPVNLQALLCLLPRVGLQLQACSPQPHGTNTKPQV
ncbi:unnamed protein product [Prunus armeniaca]|uniref:Uncharacterized protein n=1 Tax=Prunus armeniaca TaxID=36596 RepID=A0A6J5TN14_PRUAR|nr:unnamed protein product [Prunus armeniaca]CAB4295665.1 unnamed protein product [Prunus armeniaca]